MLETARFVAKADALKMAADLVVEVVIPNPYFGKNRHQGEKQKFYDQIAPADLMEEVAVNRRLNITSVGASTVSTAASIVAIVLMA